MGRGVADRPRVGIGLQGLDATAGPRARRHAQDPVAAGAAAALDAADGLERAEFGAAPRAAVDVGIEPAGVAVGCADFAAVADQHGLRRQVGVAAEG
jgi:hypothetical protein